MSARRSISDAAAKLICKGRAFGGQRRSFAAVVPLAATLIVQLFAGSHASAQTHAPPVILDDGRTAGYLSIGWPDAAGETIVLQMNDGSGWQTAYRGPDRASTFSGLPDGLYRFRVGAPETAKAWSPALRVRITHHSLARAFGFFGLGAGVFLVLLLLLAAARRAERDSGGTGASS